MHTNLCKYVWKGNKFSSTKNKFHINSTNRKRVQLKSWKNHLPKVNVLHIYIFWFSIFVASAYHNYHYCALNAIISITLSRAVIFLGVWHFCRIHCYCQHGRFPNDSCTRMLLLQQKVMSTFHINCVLCEWRMGANAKTDATEARVGRPRCDWRCYWVLIVLWGGRWWWWWCWWWWCCVY